MLILVYVLGVSPPRPPLPPMTNSSPTVNLHSGLVWDELPIPLARRIRASY